MRHWGALGYISLQETGKVQEGVGREFVGLLTVLAISRGAGEASMSILDQNWLSLSLILRLKVRRRGHPGHIGRLGMVNMFIPIIVRSRSIARWKIVY